MTDSSVRNIKRAQKESQFLREISQLFMQLALDDTKLQNLTIDRVKLSPRQMGLLRVILSEGPLSQQALSKRHKVDRTTLVQIIDELQERQLVSRITDEHDRRINLLYLTPRGKKTLAQAIRIADKEQSKFLEPLNDDEWNGLRATLIKLINHHLSSD